MDASRNKRSAARKFLVAVGLATICGGHGVAAGDDYYWNHPVGGPASDPNNWVVFGFPPDMPPGPGDHLRFAATFSPPGDTTYWVRFTNQVPQSLRMTVTADVDLNFESDHTTGAIEIPTVAGATSRLETDGAGTLSCTSVNVGFGSEGLFTPGATAEFLVENVVSGDLTAGARHPSGESSFGIVEVPGSLTVSNAYLGTGSYSVGQVHITAGGEFRVSGDLDIGYNGDNGIPAGRASDPTGQDRNDLVRVSGSGSRVYVTGTTRLGDPDNDRTHRPEIRVENSGYLETGSLVATDLGETAKLDIQDGLVFTDTLDVVGHVVLGGKDAGSHARLNAESGTISGGLVIGSNGHPATFVSHRTMSWPSTSINVDGWAPSDGVSVVVGPSGTLTLQAHILPTAAVIANHGYRQDASGTLRVEYGLSSAGPYYGLLDASGGNAYLDGTLRIDVLATPAQEVEHVILKAAQLLGPPYPARFATVIAPAGWGVVYDYTSTPQTVSIRFTAPVACSADFNNSGTVSVQDIFDFLAAFFSYCEAPGDPPCYRSADVNNSGTISVQDIFTFLEHYFSGCI